MIVLPPQLLGPGDADSKKSLTTSSFAVLLQAMSLNKTVTDSNTSSAVLVDIVAIVIKRESAFGGIAIVWKADMEKAT